MTIEFFSQVFQGLSYLLLLVVLAFLWSRVARRTAPRPFWQILALGWTLNLGGTLAWIVHDLLTGRPLDAFSVVDLFYVSRYLLLGLALWQFPVALPGRAALGPFLAGLAVFSLLGGLYLSPVWVTKTGSWVDFWGYSLYPILDTLLITLAARRLRAVWGSPWAKPTEYFSARCSAMAWPTPSILLSTPSSRSRVVCCRGFSGSQPISGSGSWPGPAAHQRSNPPTSFHPLPIVNAPFQGR